MAEGWICPRCQLVLAPWVAEHKCKPPGPPSPAPTVPGGGGGGGGGGGSCALAVTEGTAWTVT